MPPRRPQRPRATGLSLRLNPASSAHTTGPNSASLSAPTPLGQEEPDDIVSSLSLSSLTISDSSEPVKETAAQRAMRRRAQKPFRFLDLPSELRIEIYARHFADGGDVVDLDSDNYKRIHKKLAILRTCRTIYHEASHVFYSTNTFRVFPTQPGRFFKTKKPLLARLNTRQRRLLTSLELRLGPGWNKPPRGWVVNSALGLAECVNVRKLTVFVECDPSDGVFNGFRKADGFYETFSKSLLDGLLGELPVLDRVHFDAWSSVKKSGSMMTGLLNVAKARGMTICWGPERQWTDNVKPGFAVACLGDSGYHAAY